MLPEIGQVALVLALVAATVQTVMPLLGAQRNVPAWMDLARPAAWLQLALLALHVRATILQAAEDLLHRLHLQPIQDATGAIEDHLGEAQPLGDAHGVRAARQAVGDAIGRRERL